ncbi:MAG: hypothetical protein ACLPWF_29660 [Bryobacteraceae bacterium]|jgi:hypothetical protein
MKALWLLLVGAVVIELSHGLFAPRVNGLPPAPAEWKLVDQAVLQTSSHEAKVWNGTSGALKVWRASYVGNPPAGNPPASNPTMMLTLYQMPWSPGSAWDAIQEWRTLPGAMAFAKGRYFGVAESPGAERSTLKRFVQGVTAALPPGSETFQ